MECYIFNRSEIMTDLMRFVSFWGDGLMPIFLVLLASLILLMVKEKFLAVVILLAPMAGELIKQLLRNLFRYERPYLRGCFDITGQLGFSFPSGHTVFFTIFFGLIAYFLWSIKRSRITKFASIFPIVMVLSVGYSRVYLGAHWASDVLAGYGVGFAVLLITIQAIKKWKK